MLRGKTGKLFCFSLLGDMVQFDNIIFRRTFEELFWSVRVDWKKSHYDSRVSLKKSRTMKSKNPQNLINSQFPYPIFSVILYIKHGAVPVILPFLPFDVEQQF